MASAAGPWAPLGLLGSAVRVDGSDGSAPKWLSAAVDCAEGSSPVSDPGALWAVLLLRPSSEICQAVFMAWFPGELIASVFVPSVMTGALTASEPSSCSAAASIFNAPASETVPAGAPLMTSTVPLSLGVSAVLCETGLSFRAAPESTVSESDPETVLVSTAVSFPLIAKLDVLSASAPEAAAALTATATAVLNATMMASSAAAAAAFLRLLASSGVVGVGACTTGITGASVVGVETSVLVVDVLVVVFKESVAVVKTSVVVVEAPEAVVDVGGSVISVPPLPSLWTVKFAVV